MNPQIRYWSNANNDVYPTSLEISDSLVATLRVGCDIDGPGEAGMGVFVAALEPDQVQPIKDILLSPGFAAIKKPEPAPPGSVVRKLGVMTEEHGEVLRYAIESAPADSFFLKAEEPLLALLSSIRRHPEHSVALHNVSIAPGTRSPADLELSLDVVNTGAKDIQLHHPNTWGEVPFGLELTATRNDVALADLRSHHRVFMSLGHQQLIEIDPTPPDSSHIPLAVGQHLTLRYRIELELEPGAYDVVLTLQIPIFNAQGTELITGEIFSKTSKLAR